MTPEEFISNIDIRSPSECWEWKRCRTPHGYGTLRAGHKKYQAHRYAWIVFNDEIPNGLCVCHTCDNKLCCNPKHLFLGTLKDNIDDMIKKGRQQRVKGADKLQAKLTERQVKEIRNRALNGEKVRNICQEFGICRTSVINIKNGIKWRHLWN